MKISYLLILRFVLTSTVALPAHAKPLSHVGGTMVMQENDETGHTLSIDYTFDPHFAVGLYSKYEIGGDEFWMAGPQLNTLFKRWAPRLDVPVFFFLGRHDHTVTASAAMAERYFTALDAPRGKRLIWFEHSGHWPQLEEPQRFQTELIRAADETSAP